MRQAQLQFEERCRRVQIFQAKLLRIEIGAVQANDVGDYSLLLLQAVDNVATVSIGERGDIGEKLALVFIFRARQLFFYSMNLPFLNTRSLELFDIGLGDFI